MTVAVAVSTFDAAVAVAPFKVSAKPSHDTATVTINVTGTAPVYAYRLMRGGSAITNGVEIATLGAVTGIARCVSGVLFAKQAGPTALSTPRSFDVTINFADFGGGADGAYAMNLYVYRAGAFE